jgi:hypothetical protein
VRAAHLLSVLVIAGLTSCRPGTAYREPALDRDEAAVKARATNEGRQPGYRASEWPAFRAGVYTGRIVRRYLDARTAQVPMEQLMRLGSAAYDELLRFEMDRSFMRRYDPAGWDAFKSQHQLDDLEIPDGTEVDIGLLAVARDGGLGFVAGNNAMTLVRSGREPDSSVIRARFSGRQITGEWHAFRQGASSGIAFRFTPREDSGLYSLRSVSLSNAVAEGMSDDVLFYYGLNVFPGRIVVELAILYWRGSLEGQPRVSPWPPEEFRLVFQEKARRDFGGDQRALEKHLLELASFLSQEDLFAPPR